MVTICENICIGLKVESAEWNVKAGMRVEWDVCVVITPPII